MREADFYLGNPVYSLQTMLRQISDFDSRVLPVVPDGYFGPSTIASVRSFQQAYGLPVTGDVDEGTWNTIVRVHNMARAERNMPNIQPLWFPGQSIEPGEENVHLLLVQAMLTALSRYYPELEAPRLTGILDPVTEQDLKWIQQSADLPRTGALNTLTWHALTGLYRITTGIGE